MHACAFYDQQKTIHTQCVKNTSSSSVNFALHNLKWNAILGSKEVLMQDIITDLLYKIMVSETL
jgi:hypothetical protein